MNPDMSALLDQLHDVHTPAPVSSWPPALGWWLVLVLLIGLMLLIVWWFRRRKRSMKKVYLREFQKIRVDFAVNRDKDLLLQNMSILLRRITKVLEPSHENASSLTGSAWLNYLDQVGKTSEFSHGVGKVLADGPYRKSTDYDEEQLLLLVQQWLGKLP